MSYVELGSVVFRGNLKGAVGAAKFTLTADAIDAVDGINIRNGSISSYVIVSAHQKTIVPPYSDYLTATINGDADGDLIDVIAYADSEEKMVFKLNGDVIKSNNKRYSVQNDLLMFRGFFHIKAGQNIILINNSKNVSAEVGSGILMAGYMRKTGLYTS